VKVIRRNEQSHLSQQNHAASSNLFVFYEKSTGATHFHVEALPNGQFPVDQAAGLLAMHCMVRGQSPSDYVVMVQADAHVVGGVNERAEKLLQAGHSAKCTVKLTRREEEVLDGILRSHGLHTDGTLRDTYVYSITAAEWPAVRAHLKHQLARDRPAT